MAASGPRRTPALEYTCTDFAVTGASMSMVPSPLVNTWKSFGEK